MFYFRLLSISLLFGIWLSSFAARAHAQTYWEIEDHETYGLILTVVVQGEITQADTLALSSAVQSGTEAPIRQVILSSEGGDVHAAMQMGRMLRANGFDAVIPDGHTCMSACVFLLAATINKSVFGTVGIHRPYFVSGPSENVAEEILEVKALLAAFLREVNVSDRLVEDMFSVDPGQMRILTPRELEDYRLNSTDFVSREETTLRMMSDLGISRQTYEAFRSDLDYYCRIFTGQPTRMATCIDDVARKYGISMELNADE